VERRIPFVSEPRLAITVGSEFVFDVRDPDARLLWWNELVGRRDALPNLDVRDERTTFAHMPIEIDGAPVATIPPARP
jgi:hypothetical protein